MKIEAVIEKGLIIHAENLSQFDGKKVSVEIKEYRKQRTNPQNDYYWGVVIVYAQKIFLDEWFENMSPEKCHDTLRMLFLSKEIVNVQTGEIVKVPISTKTLKTDEFSQYIDSIRVWAKDYFSIIIPLPNE